ncbi:uncharacterized protein HD556DRAFT_1529138 [Suillus plorans]|uniref:Uncharacterized protein n=1 Tax=Suillus plorans TaxID=116603 RepID=A0A9P7AIA3_9AGAM|nr:uncharacterized protein HD556DRAFT_1529138 [Suillus plorans]KAG1790057.1 hypothetical protein HD556DRAFT_1529138 [Suillus plorans]
MLFPTPRTPCANAQHTSATADVAQTNTDDGREQEKGRRQGGERERERGDGRLVALECFDSARPEEPGLGPAYLGPAWAGPGPQAEPCTSLDEHGNITIDAKFQNAFIMAGVVCFVWREGREAFLGASPLKAIKYVMASVGSGTHCALQEQRSAVITVDAFGGQHHEEKFKEIVQAFDDLTDEEKLELESYLQYVLDVGPSQAGNGESSSDSE